jgi:uncharacterized membrane protein YcaP (DUF421 family)
MTMLHFLIGPDNGDGSVLQICARTAFLFGFGILCIRIAGRRTFAEYSPLDIVVAVVVGSNISRIMTGKAPFVPGLCATLLLVLLHRVVAMASLGWPALACWVKGRPVELIRDGKVDRQALRRHELSEDDLLEALRLEKVDDPAKVSRATLEGGGKISVVPKN